jgi:hypothetical protein
VEWRRRLSTKGVGCAHVVRYAIAHDATRDGRDNNPMQSASRASGGGRQLRSERGGVGRARATTRRESHRRRRRRVARQVAAGGRRCAAPPRRRHARRLLRAGRRRRRERPVVVVVVVCAFARHIDVVECAARIAGLRRRLAALVHSSVVDARLLLVLRQSRIIMAILIPNLLLFL